jgi:hypothetical protein
MAAKKRSDEIENAAPVNVFEPDLQASQGFKMDDLFEAYNKKLGEVSTRKIAINERIARNREALSRINQLIEQLSLKAAQETGLTWQNAIVRNVAAEIQKVFAAASVEVTPMNGSVVLTVSKRGISPADRMRGQDSKALTLVQMENGGIGVRDFSQDTGEYPAGSLGALAGLNFKVVPVPSDRIIPSLVEWILK